MRSGSGVFSYIKGQLIICGRVYSNALALIDSEKLGIYVKGITPQTDGGTIVLAAANLNGIGAAPARV